MMDMIDIDNAQLDKYQHRMQTHRIASLEFDEARSDHLNDLDRLVLREELEGDLCRLQSNTQTIMVERSSRLGLQTVPANFGLNPVSGL